MRHMDEGLLQAWLDVPRSGLSAEERAAVESHLAACPECAARAEAMRGETGRVAELLASADMPGEIPEFAAVRDRARELGGQVRTPGRRLARLGWAASVMVALGAGWIWNEMSGGIGPSVLPAGGAGVLERADEAQEASEGTAGAARFEDVSADRADPVPTTIESTLSAPDAAPPAELRALEIERPEPTPQAGSVDLERAVLPAPASTAPLAESLMSQEVAGPAAAEARRRVEVAPVAVRGRVTDAETGRPLEGAQVVVAGTRTGALTTPEGEFLLFVEPPSDSIPVELRLAAQMIGYAMASRSITFSGVDSVSADFEMSATAIELSALAVRTLPGEEDVAPAAGDALLIDGLPVEWRSVTRAGAEEAAGFPVRTIPWLEVVHVEVGALEDTRLVRVVHELRGGRRLTLLQGGRVFAVSGDDGTIAQVDTLLRDGVFLVGRAPLPADSIRTLLREAR